MKPVPERPTIKKIAQISGYTIGTVDRALHNRPGIKPETRTKVLEVAHTLNYRVNKLASAMRRQRTLVFGAIFPKELHYFYDDVRCGFLDAVYRLRDFRVEPLLQECERLGRGEEEALTSLLRAKVNGVLFSPGHHSKFNHLINDFADSGIPVITVSTDAPASHRLCSIHVDPEKNGELAGELVSRFLEKGGKTAVMVGSMEVEDHRKKVEGFTKYISSLSAGPSLTAVFENQENEELAFENTQKLFEKYPDLGGIYLATANSVSPCRYLEEQSRYHQVKVITTDLFQELIPFLKKEVISATIYQNPYRQGYEAVNRLFNYLTEGEKPPENIALEPIIIMKSNLEYYQRVPFHQ